MEKREMQSMMEEAERSAERVDAVKNKAEEIRENLENHEMEKFLKIYLKVKHELDDFEGSAASTKVFNLAWDVFGEKAGYIPALEGALNINDQIYCEVAAFYPENKGRIDGLDEKLANLVLSPQYVKRFVNGELRIPTLSEWKKADDKFFVPLRFIPNEHGDNSLREFLEKTLKKYGWSVNGEIDPPWNEYLIAESRMRMIYPLFISAGDLLGQSAESAREKMEAFIEIRDQMKLADSNLNVVGLNLNEFLYSFLCALVNDVDIDSLDTAYSEGMLIGQRLYKSGTNSSLEPPCGFQSVKVFPDDETIAVYNDDTFMNPRLGLVVPGIHK